MHVLDIRNFHQVKRNLIAYENVKFKQLNLTNYSINT